jgi:hypothetical protein
MIIESFKEGGWGMWPILILCLVTVGAAVRFAYKPERRHLGFLGAIGFASVICILHATWTCFGSVFHTISDEARVPDAQMTRTLYVGLMESTRPGSLGGALLTLAAILFSVGMLRMDRAEE